MKRWQFMQKQALPYEAQVTHAIQMGREFYEAVDGKCFVSVGGLDSITLLTLLRQEVSKDILAASVSNIEDKSIQAVHKKFDHFENVKSYKSKIEVIRDHGFPIISKAKARKIELLQTPNCPKQTFIHAIMTGDMGEQGKFQHSDKIKLPEKWIKLFGGLYNDHRPDLKCQEAPFKVSDQCCKWMKEKPLDDFAKERGLYPYMGLMACEGGQREMALIKNGCNYFGKEVIRSCPLAIFTRDNLLHLALDLKVPIPEIYGEIVKLPNGHYDTTKAKRTGCSMCGFGIHLDKRPHHFDQLRAKNYNEWLFWMYEVGWGEVLSYIGVGWENEIKDMSYTVQQKIIGL